MSINYVQRGGRREFLIVILRRSNPVEPGLQRPRIIRPISKRTKSIRVTRWGRYGSDHHTSRGLREPHLIFARRVNPTRVTLNPSKRLGGRGNNGDFRDRRLGRRAGPFREIVKEKKREDGRQMRTFRRQIKARSQAMRAMLRNARQRTGRRNTRHSTITSAVDEANYGRRTRPKSSHRGTPIRMRKERGRPGAPGDRRAPRERAAPASGHASGAFRNEHRDRGSRDDRHQKCAS